MVKKVIDEGLDDARDDDDDDENEGRFRDLPGDDDEDNDDLVIDFDDESDPDGKRKKKDADEDDDDPDPDPDEDPAPDPDEEEAEGKGKKAATDEDDDDLEGYSEKVRKRIERERRLKKQERERADNAERELARIREEQAAATIEQRLDGAIEELEDARRDADTRKEALAQARVTLLSQEQEQLKQRRERAEKEGGSGQKEAERNPAFRAWAERNSWFDDKKFSAQRAAAIAAAQDLIDEGDRDDSDAFYRKLDRRLRETVHLPKADKPEPRRTTLGRLPESQGTSGGGSRVVITVEDKALMRKMGMDPTNKMHLREYAKEKRNG